MRQPVKWLLHRPEPQNTNTKNTNRVASQYRPLCKRLPFAVWKVTYCTIKGGLLRAKRPPFAKHWMSICYKSIRHLSRAERCPFAFPLASFYAVVCVLLAWVRHNPLHYIHSSVPYNPMKHGIRPPPCCHPRVWMFGLSVRVMQPPPNLPEGNEKAAPPDLPKGRGMKRLMS